MSSTFKSTDTRKTGSSKDGDWICPDLECKNLNFARRNQCNRCGQDRSGKSLAEDPGSSSSSSSVAVDSTHGGSKKKAGIEIGKVAAEKSRGLFSAEDWQCSKCANVNWARRHTCNLCNAPRFCEVEERTGYGGGYNDRGVVEYKSRSESDDEYDEFGRKKKKSYSDQRKKYSKNSESSNTSRKIPAKHDSSNEDDDDDEENEDLSKYDLWGSDEENDKIDSTKTNRKSTSGSKQKSRSRSRSPRCFKERDRR